MRFNRFFRASAGLAGVAGLFFLTTNHATAQEGPDDLFNRGVALLQDGQYPGAEEAFSTMIERFERDAERLFGPRFGTVYFHRGVALEGQRRFQEAADDFEVSATRYANRAGDRRINPYATMSLLHVGGALMRIENPDYELVLEVFQRFQRQVEDDPPDAANIAYNRATLLANIAISEARAQRPRNAAQTFRRLMSDPGGFCRETRSNFQKTQQTVHAAASEIVESFQVNDIPDAGLEFVDEFRPALTEDRAISYFYTPRYLEAASNAAREGYYAFALSIYSILPTSQQVLDGLALNRARLEAFPHADGRPREMANVLDRIEQRVIEDMESGTPVDAWVLDGVARVFFLNGNQQAAYGTYRTLIDMFPNSQLRPQMLYFAAATASTTGRLAATQQYGERFLEEYPDHELRDRVEELLLESLFWNARYEEALAVGKDVRERATQDDMFELSDFVIGGSLYFLGRFPEAERELRAFREKWPDSERTEPARYYLADNLARLNRFVEAGAMLDSFLNDYPNSELLDLALYSRANVHYNQEELNPAVTRLGQFLSQRPNSEIRDQALNLLGNINDSLGNTETAEQNYRDALAFARRLGNRSTAAQSLIFLMGLLSEDEERDEEVVELAEEFFRDHPNDLNRARAAVVPLDAMDRLGRIDEGLARIESLIPTFGEDLEAAGMEDLILAYVKHAEAGGLSMEELRERLYNFPRVPESAVALRARLMMALIDFYEQRINEEDDEATVARMEGEIRGVFGQLRREFPIESLSNYILVRVGDYLVRYEEFAAAREYFDRAIESPDTEFQDRATFNLGFLLLLSESREDNRRAFGYFDRIMEDFRFDRLLVEETFRMRALGHEMLEEWDRVESVWREYLRYEGGAFRRYQTEAFYKIGLSFDRRGQWEAAMDNYAQVWVLDPGNLLFSAPAWFRMAEINFHERGHKQNAYENLWDMVRRAAGGIGHLEAEEQRILDNPDQYADRLNRRLMADRLQRNYIAHAKRELEVWERDPGVTAKSDEP